MVGTRYRPPAEKSTAIITREGYERLKAELDQLWRVLRPEVVVALAAAAAEGDRSENAEYTYRKKQLGEIDRRVRYLTKRLENFRVVDEPPTNQSVIFFGAWFTVEDERGLTQTFRIVGPDETDAKKGWISCDSPLALAALKKHVDDDITVQTPEASRNYVVIAVRYQAKGGA
jgi:transcription elongation factor GreB